ncbi:TPA: hypothetical protein ACQQ5N_002784 [Pseudomonas aeruginosa]
MTKAALQKLMINIGMAAAAALLFTLAFGTFTNSHWIAYTVLMTVVFASAIFHVRNRMDLEYEKRINASAPSIWEIQVNGVAVGHISDSDYAKFQRQIFHDFGTALAQGQNYFKVVINVASMYVKVVPMLCFWTFALAVTFIPDTVQQVLAETSQVGPEQLTTQLASVLRSLALLTFATCLIAPIPGLDFGFQNEYRKAVDKRVRVHCKTPAEGEINLFYHGRSTASCKATQTSND